MTRRRPLTGTQMIVNFTPLNSLKTTDDRKTVVKDSYLQQFVVISQVAFSFVN